MRYGSFRSAGRTNARVVSTIVIPFILWMSSYTMAAPTITIFAEGSCDGIPLEGVVFERHEAKQWTHAIDGMEMFPTGSFSNLVLEDTSEKLYGAVSPANSSDIDLTRELRNLHLDMSAPIELIPPMVWHTAGWQAPPRTSWTETTIYPYERFAQRVRLNLGWYR